MTNRKENISYTFTVEGDTEKWYLDWLEKQMDIPISLTKVCASFARC